MGTTTSRVPNFSLEVKELSRMQPNKKPLTMFICTCGTSTLFLILGILLVTLWSVLYEAIIKSNLTLKPSSAAFDVWKKNPLPVTLKIFVFNWTNSEEVYRNDSKPRFQQLGPYTFEETKEKTDITWNANNTVSYKHLKRWWFKPEESNGSLFDSLTTINPVALSAAHQIRNWHYILKKTVSISLTSLSNTVHVTKPVGEVLFDGYQDPLLSMAVKLPYAAKNVPKLDRFGWFYGRNGSEEYDGTFNIQNGVDAPIGELNTWKYANHTPYYPGRCSRVDNSSAGDFFPRNLKEDSVIRLFTSDLCRVIELEFERKVIISGIIGYKYSAGDRFLDNGTKIPENKCYCDGDCMPYGAVNVSNCRHGSPAFVSLPHFRKADPSYLDGIEGLNPKPGVHDMFMIFEPKTGIPLRVSARLQLNLRVEPVENILLFEKVPTFYFPVLYFEQVVSLPESMLFTVKVLVNFETICNAVGISLIFLGILLLGCTGYNLCTTNLFGKKKGKVKEEAREEVPLKQ